MNATDFSKHNEEVKLVWESYNAGRPVRVPFGYFTIGPRIWVLGPRLNTEGITWEAMSTDPELMFQTYLKYKYYLVHNIPHDIEMGIPAKCWEIGTEFVNVFEEGWLGCPVVYPEGQVTATLPRCAGARKEEIFEGGIPGPFDGFMARVKEYYEYFLDKAKNYEFHGRPVSIYPPCPIAHGGPLTVAIGVRGHEILEDMLVDEDYFHRLMDFIVEATIVRVRAWRSYLGMELRPKTGGFSDDAIQFLSARVYREKVLPYHRRIAEALFDGGPLSMHLCGNVQRHLPTIVKEINVKAFDTGYPIDFCTLRDQVGEDVEIWGGVTITDLMTKTPPEIYETARMILQSGILRGGRFVMKEANNMPPGTPLENIAAMYRAVKDFGVYSY
jgi:hypothetical protein